MILGPQHIGLSTLTMAPTVARLSARGVVFRKPPPTYYDLEVIPGVVGSNVIIFFQGKREQIVAIREDPGVFKELGILIDPEVAIATIITIITIIVIRINITIIITATTRLEREE